MTSTTAPQPSPISVSTSQAWDNDGGGLWSTFVVSVGTPAQDVRVQISTAGDETWVVLSAGCPDYYGNTCGNDRGGIFNLTESTSWANVSLAELDLEVNLGYNGNAVFARDEVELGYPNSGAPKLSNQIVGGMAAADFWLGQFGLDPAPSNFTYLNDPQPSFLWTLVNQSVIPSTTWGYTAGASYMYDKVQGSLTLGGFDASRFGLKNVTFPFYPDTARRLIVDVTTITYIPTGISTTTTTTTLMSETISMYIDSTIPFIYLPTALCTRFETAFGLQWDDVNEIYTVSSDVHAALINMNPNITFTLSNTAGETLDIVLPYTAFDLTATFPVLSQPGNSTNYFPLKRADNDTQYTLGRTFLQEAYLIADYDRSEFTVAPCVWPPTFTQDIRAIYQPGSTSTPVHKHKIPVTALAGGAIGALVLIIITILAYWHLIYKPKHKPPSPPAVETPALDKDDMFSHPLFNKPELDGVARNELSGSLVDEKSEVEISGTPILGEEMDGEPTVRAELETPLIFEMPAREAVGNELYSPRKFSFEEETSPVPLPVPERKVEEDETTPKSEGILSPLSIITSRNVGVRLEETILSPASVVSPLSARFERRHETFYNQ